MDGILVFKWYDRLVAAAVSGYFAQTAAWACHSDNWTHAINGVPVLGKIPTAVARRLRHGMRLRRPRLGRCEPGDGKRKQQHCEC
jgi:hypothetical protein